MNISEKIILWVYIAAQLHLNKVRENFFSKILSFIVGLDYTNSLPLL